MVAPSEVTAKLCDSDKGDRIYTVELVDRLVSSSLRLRTFLEADGASCLFAPLTIVRVRWRTFACYDRSPVTDAISSSGRNYKASSLADGDTTLCSLSAGAHVKTSVQT